MAAVLVAGVRGTLTHMRGNRFRLPHIQRNHAPHETESCPTPNGIAPHMKRNADDPEKRDDETK